MPCSELVSVAVLAAGRRRRAATACAHNPKALTATHTHTLNCPAANAASTTFGSPLTTIVTVGSLTHASEQHRRRAPFAGVSAGSRWNR